MPHRARALLPLLGVIALAGLPTSVVAQANATDWSRIIHPYSSLQCTTERPCPARIGLVWDSTNAFPKYPQVLAGVGVGGEVVVRFRVGEAGAVESASVAVVKSTNRAFDQNSMDAISRWRFGSEADGRPAGPIETEVRVTFARMDRCPDTVQGIGTGWAGFNQLVVTSCSVLIRRSQVPPRG
jgi:TonB family protein